MDFVKLLVGRLAPSLIGPEHVTALLSLAKHVSPLVEQLQCSSHPHARLRPLCESTRFRWRFAFSQLAADGQDGPFLQAVLEMLVDVANAVPSLFGSSHGAVQALLAEDDSQLAATAARLLAAMSSTRRPETGGAAV